MIDLIRDFILDEAKWMPLAMATALVAVVALLRSRRANDTATRSRVLAAMSLFFGTTIGVMAFGHLLAVTTKLVTGRLEGSIVLFYGIGLALAIPSWWLACHAWRRVMAEPESRLTLGLNLGLALTLLLLGLTNLPLALPGFFNTAFQLHRRPAVGWTIVGLAIAATVALFIGSLAFAASGQSFEEYMGG